MKRTRLIPGLLLNGALCTGLVFGTAGCPDGTFEDAGEDLDEAGEEVGDEIDDATDDE